MDVDEKNQSSEEQPMNVPEEPAQEPAPVDVVQDDASQAASEAQEPTAPDEEQTSVAPEESEAEETGASPAVEDVDAPVAAEPAMAEAPVAAGPARAWYVVHCYSGYENKVRKSLEQRISNMDVEGLIFRIVVPTEEEIDVREGQRKVVQRRVFPGYVLVEMMRYDPENPESKRAWYVVRNTPGVTGFVSSGDIPTPLREDEVLKILKRMETDQPKVRVTYRKGQVVHIIDGPFADFRGTVDEVNMEKGKVRVMVSFFGRDTPVELDLLQVEKV